MDDDRRGSRSGDYRGARIGAAVALVMVTVVIVVFDAISPTYEVSPYVLTILLGTVTGLLGITIIRR